MKKKHAIATAQPDENNLIPVPCSYDMGWQKRGKGSNSIIHMKRSLTTICTTSAKWENLQIVHHFHRKLLNIW